VRRGESVGDLGHDLQTGGHRYGGQTALGSGPFVEIAGGGPLGFEEIGSLLEVPVENADDVPPVPQLLLEKPNEGHLPLETGQPLPVIAELVDSLFMSLLVLGTPDVSETAGADLFLEDPVGTVGHFDARGGPPSGDGVQIENALDLVGVCGRGQRCRSLPAHLIHFDRLGHASEHVGSVRQPGEVGPGAIGLRGSPTRQVEGHPGQEGLPSGRHRHDPRDHRLGNPLHLDRLGPPGHIGRGIGPPDDLTDMDPDPRLEGDLERVAQGGELVVVGDRVADGADGPVEQDEKAVGLVDLLATELGEEIPRHPVVLLEDGRGPLISELFGETGAPDQVRGEEGAEEGRGHRGVGHQREDDAGNRFARGVGDMGDGIGYWCWVVGSGDGVVRDPLLSLGSFRAGDGKIRRPDYQALP